MGFISWLVEKFRKEEDFEIEDYEFACPKCGSKQLGYSTVICNFASVVAKDEDPQYVQTVHCYNCGFKHQGKPEDQNNEYLRVLTRTKKE